MGRLVNVFLVFVVFCAEISTNQEDGKLVSGEKNLVHCTRPPYETFFHIIVAGLLHDECVPPGDILDIGANKGDLSCFYGCLQPNRTVHSVDPNPVLVSQINCPTKNVKKHNYAMSEQPGWIHWKPRRGKSTYVGKLEHKRSTRGNIEVLTLDTFFARENSTPGFLHLDVEGYELALINGGASLLSETHPLFSFEVLLGTASAVQTIAKVQSLGYSVYMVNEICGISPTCRNLLAIPNGSVRAILKTATFQAGLLSGSLQLIRSGQSNALPGTTVSPPFPRFLDERLKDTLRAPSYII